jgi:hypothetical protein
VHRSGDREGFWTQMLLGQGWELVVHIVACHAWDHRLARSMGPGLPGPGPCGDGPCLWGCSSTRAGGWFAR